MTEASQADKACALVARCAIWLHIELVERLNDQIFQYGRTYTYSDPEAVSQVCMWLSRNTRTERGIEDKKVAQNAREHVAILHPLISPTQDAVTD